MFSFGEKSEEKLKTCHYDLQKLFLEVVKNYDCSILEGHRDQAAQDEAFRKGLSKKKWPTGEHNKTPSMAVDVAPYPIDWNDTKRFYHFAGYVKAKAESLGINIRWGGDWNSNNNFKDENFFDLVHFELIT